MTDDDVRLTLRRTGGLAGLPMEATAGAADLDPRTLDAALAALDALKGGARDAGAAGPPDGFSYHLEVRRGDDVRAYDLAEHAAPEAVRPLLRALMARAEPAPRR